MFYTPFIKKVSQKKHALVVFYPFITNYFSVLLYNTLPTYSSAIPVVNYLHIIICEMLILIYMYVLFSGVGTVMETNCWSDIAYAQTLADQGYFSRKGNVLNYLLLG